MRKEKKTKMEITPDDITKHIPLCENVAKGMHDIAFDDAWKRFQEAGAEEFGNEGIAGEFYITGASSMLLLLLKTGMPSGILDRLDEVMREAKKMRVGEGKVEVFQCSK